MMRWSFAKTVDLIELPGQGIIYNMILSDARIVIVVQRGDPV